VPEIGAHAEEIDTDHLFAFSTGTDIGEVGTRELESATSGRFAKGGGRYTASSQGLEAAYIPAKDVHLFSGASLAYFDIDGVAGFEDRQQASFGELSFEARYRLMDRARSPFGLAIQMEPSWGMVDETDGEQVDRFGGEFAVLIDKEIVEDVLVSVLNILYEPEASRSHVTSEWSSESTLGFTGALMAQIRPNLFIGAEAQYFRAYEGLGFDRLAGEAAFLGPSLCWHPKGLWLIAGWGSQVAGRAVGGSDSLDLVNFERYRATLKFGFNF
jgi:hypothetical protein